MNKIVLVGLVAIIVWAGPSLAQPLGVGVKVPLQAFVFVGFAEHFALEVGLPIGLTVGGVAAFADLKLFFGSYELVSLLWRPFVGGVGARGPRQGPARRQLPHHPWGAGLGGRRGPQARTLQVRRQEERRFSRSHCLTEGIYDPARTRSRDPRTARSA
jgi:hypothetical protein